MTITEKTRADLLAAADYLEGDGVTMEVAEALRIAQTLRGVAGVKESLTAGAPLGYKPVPINPPDELAPQLIGYSLRDTGMSERDQRVIREQLRTRWAAILAVLDGVEGKRNG